MDAIKKEQTSLGLISSSGDAQTNEVTARWWANWAKDHREQIEAYNKDVAENGIWSDELRTF